MARELGVSVTTARRWMAEGAVPTIVVTVGRQRPQRLARLTAVLTVKETLSSRIELVDLAAELNLGYHEARGLLLRLGHRPQPDPDTRMLLLTVDDADSLRWEVARLGHLHRRAMRIADAAGRLQVSVNRVNALLRSSVLVLDAETDAHRAKYVTRQSVESERIRRQRPSRARPSGTVEAVVTLPEAVRLTGLTKQQLAALGVTGHLHRCDAPRTRTWAVTLESLQSWAAGHRPDLLHVLTAPQPL